MKIEDRKKALKNAIGVQASNGNWNYSSYMHGMLNGMLFAEHTIFGGKLNYKDAPKKWLCDKKEKKKNPLKAEKPNALLVVED